MHNEDYEAKAYSTIQETQLKYWEKIRHPFVAGLELTPFCNLHCVHCFMQGHEKCNLLSTQEWLTVLDRLYDDGVLILYMTGGEIFTRHDFIPIYTYAKKKGFIIELLTNVTCMTDEILETFKMYPPATVSISIYGACESTYEAVTGVKGSFNKFMQNVIKLHEADIDIELKFIGLKENVKDFKLAEHFANTLGVKFKFNFEIFPAFFGDVNVLEHRLSNEEILKIEKNDEKIYRVYVANVNKCNPFLHSERVPLFTCNVASTLCYIDCNGYVSPCNKMRIKEHNILEKPLSEIWKGYIEEYAYLLAPSDYKCAKCNHIHICSPCPMINKLSTGEYHIPWSESCRLTQMRVDEFYKEEYDKYRK
jgi:radical SAM protein with 4Fe4S-binding SPASM domain